MEEIKFVIDKKGHASYDMNGFVGEACKDISNVIDNALGNVKKQGDKDDVFKVGTVQQQNVFS